jgi:hypothetical protein
MIWNNLNLRQNVRQGSHGEAFPCSLLPSDKYSADARIHGIQDQSGLQLILSHNGCERKGRSLNAHSLSFRSLESIRPTLMTLINLLLPFLPAETRTNPVPLT